MGTVPHGVPSPAFHSPRPASELTSSIVKTNLHEPGKREKRTLVLRDRSEWARPCLSFEQHPRVLGFPVRGPLSTYPEPPESSLLCCRALGPHVWARACGGEGTLLALRGVPAPL